MAVVTVTVPPTITWPADRTDLTTQPQGPRPRGTAGALGSSWRGRRTLA
jgi:hypothetical protein